MKSDIPLAVFVLVQARTSGGNMIDSDILVALIGMFGVVVAAWIGSRARSKRRQSLPAQTVSVGRDNVGGDVVGRDKLEVHVREEPKERKSALVYVLEKLFSFVFAAGVAGALFGGIGYAVGQEAGAMVGVVLGLIIGIVSAGNVKRTKGIF